METQIAKEFDRVTELLQSVLWAETIAGGAGNEFFADLLADQRKDKEECERHIKALINLITAYLERVDNSNYLEKFKAELLPRMTDPKRIYESEYVDGADELCSVLAPDIATFLAPFEFAHTSEADRLMRKAGVRYLENILVNTEKILLDLNATPRTEPKLYNTVKFVIDATFPDAKNAGSNFLKTAKEYKPDVLIPSLRVALEYKYADKEHKLASQLDAICADQKGYTGDEDYKLFFAVFYVTADFWGMPRFHKAWSDYKFPSSWRGIYVVGH